MIDPVNSPRSVAALEPGEIRRLVSIGFHGVLNGNAQAALCLFESLGTLRPRAGFPRIGRGLALMATGRADEAARVLERAHALEPQDDDVRLFYGMALRMANRGHQARAVLAQLARRGADPAARFARRLSNLPS